MYGEISMDEYEVDITDKGADYIDYRDKMRLRESVVYLVLGHNSGLTAEETVAFSEELVDYILNG